MKAITVRRPFANLIAKGVKKVVNRSWEPYGGYRGPIAIHARMSRGRLELDDVGVVDEEYATPVAGSAFGVIVAVARLADVLWLEEPDPEVLDRHPWIMAHEYTRGPCCWIFDDVYAFERPIPHWGARGIYEIPDDDRYGPEAFLREIRVERGEGQS